MDRFDTDDAERSIIFGPVLILPLKWIRLADLFLCCYEGFYMARLHKSKRYD